MKGGYSDQLRLIRMKGGQAGQLKAGPRQPDQPNINLAKKIDKYLSHPEGENFEATHTKKRLVSWCSPYVLWPESWPEATHTQKNPWVQSVRTVA